ncbi:hypothetical protein CHS0354_018415 [Potamilus streckersoni]|uniref:orotate phosphoribosyltransferase n=1 Tax=Potamilus streckersoni TaxID=2493646 RepID=A0AAE0TAW6_9BIVA|nr:hypothetical protein CHS0354_018415 [Potamilus streckersoni]
MTVLTPELKTEVARALLNAGAVGFSLNRPIVFKSGIRSPVYVDNRRLPFYPDCWRPVIRAFSEYARALSPLPDVIAGVAVGGVPHSATVGYITGIPSVFVRKESKGYGKDQLVEGGDVRGLRVLLTEDLITTGGEQSGCGRGVKSGGGCCAGCGRDCQLRVPRSGGRVCQCRRSVFRAHRFQHHPFLRHRLGRGNRAKLAHQPLLIMIPGNNKDKVPASLSR